MLAQAAICIRLKVRTKILRRPSSSEMGLSTTWMIPAIIIETLMVALKAKTEPPFSCTIQGPRYRLITVIEKIVAPMSKIAHAITRVLNQAGGFDSCQLIMNEETNGNDLQR